MREGARTDEDFWETRGNVCHELFLIMPDSQDKFAFAVTQTISRLFLFGYSDDASQPTGVAIEFVNDQRLYSVPDTYGNGVRTSMKDYGWPTPITLRAIE